MVVSIQRMGMQSTRHSLAETECMTRLSLNRVGQEICELNTKRTENPDYRARQQLSLGAAATKVR